MANWSDMNIPSGTSDRKRLDEFFEKLEFKNKVWKPIRLVGAVFAFAEAWIKIKAKSGKIVSFPKYSRDLNPVTGKWEKNGCPYREGGVEFRIRFLSNVIDRNVQDNEPKKKKKLSKSERKTGFKDPKSSSWTPVRVYTVPNMSAQQIQGWSETNKKINKKTGVAKAYGLEHEKFGRDIQVKYNKDAAPASMWQLDKGKRTPLTDEEKEYLLWNLKFAVESMWDDKSKARKEWERIKENLVDENEDEDEKPKKKKRNKELEDIDEDDMMDLEDIGDKKKKKKGKKKKKK